MREAKKRKREESECGGREADARSSEQGEVKRMSSSDSVPARSDEYDVWLIRKPVKISIKDLSNMTFPDSGKSDFRVVPSARKDAPLLNCQFETAHMQMLHVPLRHVKTHKENNHLKACKELCGVVFVNERLRLLDGAPLFEEEPFVTDDQSTPKHTFHDDRYEETSFEIHSIRKKPELDLSSVKQRLKAFGVKHKKKKKKLPNLIGTSCQT